MNARYTNAVRFAALAVTLMLVGLFYTALAQVTNGTVVIPTNTLPVAPANPFPTGKDAAWFAVIPLVTFGLTWLVGKIQSLPKNLLPLLTPIFGWVIGYVIERATNANFPWWSEAGAGAVSVALYEAVKNISGAGPESKLTPTPVNNTTINR
jgi:hypothetical protein